MHLPVGYYLWAIIFICGEYQILCTVVFAAAAKSLQSCPTLSDPMDFSPPGSSVHGIFQARILKQVAMPFSKGSLQLRIKPGSPVLAGGVSTTASPGKPVQV